MGGPMKRYFTLLLVVVVALTAACAQILGFRPPGRRPFEHRAHVLQGIDCNRCHAGVSATGDEGPLHLPGPDACRACHTSPHDERPCEGCHGLPAARAGAMAAREELRFSHRAHVSRVKGNCVRCHLDIGEGAEILRPRMATCGSCHAHREQLATNKCDPCHVSLRDEGKKPDDHLIHGGNFLREHGVRAAADRQICASCHNESSCLGCHGVTAPMLPERRAFDDPMRVGVHRAGFKARHAEEARGDPGLCTTCHAPSVCSDCHAREKRAAMSGGRSPHPAGWLGLPGQRNEHGRAAWREPELCAGCHGGAGEMLCVGCHKVGGIGGNPHNASFSAGRRSKAERPCRLCHGLGP
ncbi:Cytochrome c family protein [Minicystis rosea]|nr:Cytochrome c family protein [Minicystis rosea]